LQVLVRDNNVDQALRVLKKKLQREGVLRELKLRRHYEKPSERAIREKAEAIRRARKMARKQAIREGLIAPPKRKPPVARPHLSGLFSSSLSETSNRHSESVRLAELKS
jgi:small subunit ribosomal protein S21